MTTLLVATSEGVPLRLELAGAGSRALGILLDAAILLTAYLLVLIAVLVPVGFDPSGISGFVLGLLLGGAILVVLGYHVAFHVAWAGQTPGKRAIGVRVASADGQPASAMQHVLRALLMPVEVVLWLPLPIGLLAMLVTARHQRLGDLVAGTVVVRLPRPRAEREPYPGETWSGLLHKTLPLTAGSAAHLQPEDKELLRDLLARGDLTERARRALFVEAARTYAARLGLGPFDDARDVVRELYLFAREAAGRARETPA